VPAGGFGEQGAAGGEHRLVMWRDGVDAVDEPLRQCGIVESEHDAQQRGQPPGAEEVAAGGGEVVELVQERARLIGPALGEQKLGGGRERGRDR